MRGLALQEGSEQGVGRGGAGGIVPVADVDGLPAEGVGGGGGDGAVVEGGKGVGVAALDAAGIGRVAALRHGVEEPGVRGEQAGEEDGAVEGGDVALVGAEHEAGGDGGDGDAVVRALAGDGDGDAEAPLVGGVRVFLEREGIADGVRLHGAGRLRPSGGPAEQARRERRERPVAEA